MIKTLILIVALFLSYRIIVNTTNSMVLILKQGKPRADSFLDVYFEFFCAILWGLFYYL